MLNYPWIILSLVGLASAEPGTPTAFTHMKLASVEVCPPDQPRARRMLERYLTAPAATGLRQEHGTEGISPSDVHLLVDSSDSAACRTLISGIGLPNDTPRAMTIYSARGRYFVAAINQGTVVTQNPFMVFDANFSLLGVAGM